MNDYYLFNNSMFLLHLEVGKAYEVPEDANYTSLKSSARRLYNLKKGEWVFIGRRGTKRVVRIS